MRIPSINSCLCNPHVLFIPQKKTWERMSAAKCVNRDMIVLLWRVNLLYALVSIVGCFYWFASYTTVYLN